MENDFEITRKILIFLIGITVGAGSYIPWDVHLPSPTGGSFGLPVREVFSEPLILAVFVFFYIMAEAMEPRVVIKETMDSEQSGDSP